jgi:hypothetical protein
VTKCLGWNFYGVWKSLRYVPLLSFSNNSNTYHSVMQNAGLVDVLVESGIPSTFVKLMQLFFFLPVGASEKAAKAKPEQRVVTVLLTLCNFRLAVNELLKSDSLHVLFSLLAIQCPPHNSPNRERFVPTLLFSSL